MTETFTEWHELSKFSQGDNPGAHKLNANWTKIDTALLGHDDEEPDTYPAGKLLLRTDEQKIYRNDGTLEAPVFTLVLAADEADLTGLEGATDDEVIISMHVDGDTQEAFTIDADGTLSWGSGSSAVDITVGRSSAGILEQRSGTTPQVYRIYGSATDRLEIAHSGTSGLISTNSGSISIGVNGSFKWIVEAPNGHLITNGDNAIDVGKLASNRPRSIYVGTSFVSASGGLGTPSYTFGAQTDFGFRYVTTNFMALVGSSVNLTSLSSLGIVQRNGQYLGWTSGDDATAAPDVILVRDGIAILAQKNSTNPQSLRVYGTTTGPKYLTLSHNGTNAVIDTASNGESIFLGGISGLILPNGDNVVDLGTNGGRWRLLRMGPGSAAAPSVAVGQANDGMYSEGAGDISFAISGARNFIMQGGTFFLRSNSSAISFGASNDVILARAAAGVLKQENGDNPQEFRIYGTTTNDRHVWILHDGANYGQLGVNPANNYMQFTCGGTDVCNFDALGFYPNADNTFELGTTGIGWKTIFGGNGAVGTPTFAFSSAASTGMYLESNNIGFSVNGVGIVYIGAGGLVIEQTTGAFGALLVGDGSNVLALKNSTSNQTFRVYGTTTGPKYTLLSCTSTTARLDVTDNTMEIRLGENAGAIYSYIDFYPGADNARDFGASALRWRTLYASTSVRVGGTTASTFAFNCAYGNGLAARNQGNSADIGIAYVETQNGAVDIVKVGGASSGCQLQARTGGAAPSTSDLPSGWWCLWRDTGGGTTKLYYNNAGAIQSVTLT